MFNLFYLLERGNATFHWPNFQNSKTDWDKQSRELGTQSRYPMKSGRNPVTGVIICRLAGSRKTVSGAEPRCKVLSWFNALEALRVSINHFLKCWETLTATASAAWQVDFQYHPAFCYVPPMLRFLFSSSAIWMLEATPSLGSSPCWIHTFLEKAFLIHVCDSDSSIWDFEVTLGICDMTQICDISYQE